MAAVLPFLPYIIGAVGAVAGSQSEAAALKHNAKLGDMQAVQAGNVAAAREEVVRREADQVLGSQAAAYAQSGGGMGGSAADVMRQSAVNAELDALTTRYEGELQAWGFRAGADQDRFTAGAVKQAGAFKAAGSLLSGYGNYTGKQTSNTQPSATGTKVRLGPGVVVGGFNPGI